MANRWGKSGNINRFYFQGLWITADSDCSHKIKRHLLLGRKAMTNLDSVLKKRDITLPTNVRLVKAMTFSTVIYGCEIWTIKEARHRGIDVFELLESPSDSRQIKPVNPKGNQSWLFTERTTAEPKSPILGPPDVKHQLIGKNLDAGKNWGEGGSRGCDCWMVSSVHTCLSKLRELNECQGSPPIHGVATSQTGLRD